MIPRKYSVCRSSRTRCRRPRYTADGWLTWISSANSSASNPPSSTAFSSARAPLISLSTEWRWKRRSRQARFRSETDAEAQNASVDDPFPAIARMSRVVWSGRSIYCETLCVSPFPMFQLYGLWRLVTDFNGNIGETENATASFNPPRIHNANSLQKQLGVCSRRLTRRLDGLDLWLQAPAVRHQGTPIGWGVVLPIVLVSFRIVQPADPGFSL